MTSLHPALSWRPLSEADLPAVTELTGLCLAADGGQPYAASAGFVSQSYLAGAETIGGWDDERLVCVSALRRPSPETPDAGAVPAVTTGLVDPQWRRRGIGGSAFGWAAAAWAASARAAGPSGPGGLRAETEALSDGAHALYLSRGLAQQFAEDIMQLPAATQLPPAAAPDGLTVSEWGQADPGRFFAVYSASFGDRPGFPGWPQDRWVEWISDDDDFRPELTLLAAVRGADTGFIVGDAAGWIAQVGVTPAARGQGIGVWLVTEAVRRMRAAGESVITLNVNIDNPHAIALYRRLGFTRTGRRAKYQSPA